MTGQDNPKLIRKDTALLRAYRFLPPDIKLKYKDYTSDWLRPKD